MEVYRLLLGRPAYGSTLSPAQGRFHLFSTILLSLARLSNEEHLLSVTTEDTPGWSLRSIRTLSEPWGGEWTWANSGDVKLSGGGIPMVASERSRGTFRKMATGTRRRKDRNRLGRMDTALKNLRESISFLTPQSLSRKAGTGKLWRWTGEEGSRFGSIRNCSCFFWEITIL